MLAGRDVAGRAPTGSGKTLAFGLPLVSRLADAAPTRPTALVLAPTRELAEQISKELVPFAKAVGHWTLAVYGGVGYRTQVGALERGIYRLPFENLTVDGGTTTTVPFMGIRLNVAPDAVSAPAWNVIRRTEYIEEAGRYRPLGGMNGRVRLQRDWGEVTVDTTMVDRGQPVDRALNAMLDTQVPIGDDSLGGEMRVPGITVYWRARPAPSAGGLDLVLARQCRRASRLDNLVSIGGRHPGDLQVQGDLERALNELVRLVDCLPE